MLVKTRVDSDKKHCFPRSLDGDTAYNRAGWDAYYFIDKYDECMYLRCHKESVDYPYDAMAVMHLHYDDSYDTGRSYDDQEATWYFYIKDGDIKGDTPLECLVKYEEYLEATKSPEMAFLG